MIRVERGAEVKPGVFAWRVPSLDLGGSSHQPLLDAARAIKRMGGDTAAALGTFREGRLVPDMVSTVGAAAELTVSEPNRGRIKFIKYREADASIWQREAAE